MSASFAKRRGLFSEKTFSAGTKDIFRELCHAANALRLLQKPIKPFKSCFDEKVGRSLDGARINVERAAKPRKQVDVGEAVLIFSDPSFLRGCAEANEKDLRTAIVDLF